MRIYVVKFVDLFVNNALLSFKYLHAAYTALLLDKQFYLNKLYRYNDALRNKFKDLIGYLTTLNQGCIFVGTKVHL